MREKFVILLIEDDPKDAEFFIRQIAESHLFNQPIKVVGSLREVFELSKGDLFDATVVDLNLPDSKGHDTIKALADQAHLGAIVVLTGCEATDDDAIEAMRLGVQDYIEKGTLDEKKMARKIMLAIQRHLICTIKRDWKNVKEAIEQTAANDPGQ